MTTNDTATLSQRIRRSLEAEQALDQIIGRRLSELRQGAGMTLHDFATHAGFMAEEVADHEAGMVSIPLARVPQYARVFRRTNEDLMAALLADPEEDPG